MKKILSVLLLPLLLLGCRPAPSPQTLQSTPTPTHTLTPTATEAQAGQTPVSTPTVEIIYITPMPGGVDPKCVQGDGNASLSQSPFEDYPLAIESYLNAGASAEQLDETLYELGIASLPVSATAAEMTGDGKEEIVVSIYNPVSTSTPPSGKLLIYVCESGQYRLKYEQTSEDFQGAPSIRFLQDLNADERAELITSVASCGASTCFESIQVLDWDEGSFVNRLQGTSDDLPFPTIELTDKDSDRVYQIEVTGSGMGSVGAGPQRNLTRTWAYLPGKQQWEPVGDIPSPSNFRIHVLHDADALAEEGEYEDALLLYGRVADDLTLTDWNDPEKEQGILGAYARYRMVVLYARLGQTAFAETTLDNMESLYPDGDSLRPYYEIAQSFLDAYVSSGFSGGCQAARSYAADHSEQVLDPLGSMNFGYGNKTYTADDVCSLN